MIIDKNIKKYIVFAEDSLLHALQKISGNKMRVIFAVNESGILKGVLTDGDFRRWITSQSVIDVNQPVINVANRDFKYCLQDNSSERIESLLREGIEYIPLLDSHSRLVAVATGKTPELAIGDYAITQSSPTFIIAEIGNNHNGDLELAKRLVDEAHALVVYLFNPGRARLGGDHDKRNLRKFRGVLDQPDHLHAAHAGHVDVDKGDVHPFIDKDV